MACAFNEPIITGFSIGFLETNLVLNVQDVYGEVVANAQVSIIANSQLISGTTDNEGFFATYVRPGIVCDISISKNCLFTYEQKFMLLDLSLVDPGKNLLVKVRDTNGNWISGATVSITSDIHSDSGQTDAVGLFTGENKNDFQNTIQIVKSGFQTYTQQIHPFIKLTSDETGYAVASVITLNP